MQASYEGVIVPDEPVILVQKGLATREWRTFPLGIRRANRRGGRASAGPVHDAGRPTGRPTPSPQIYTFVNSGNPVPHLQRRKRVPTKSSKSPSHIPKGHNLPEEKGNSRSNPQAATGPELAATNSSAIPQLDYLILPLPFDIPPSLAGHLILYVNYCKQASGHPMIPQTPIGLPITPRQTSTPSPHACTP